MKKRTKIILGVVAVAAIAGVGYYFWKRRKEDKDKGEAKGEVTREEKTSTPIVVIKPTTTGTVSGATATEQKAYEPMARIVVPSVTSRAITGAGRVEVIYPELGIYIPRTAQLLPGVGGAEYLVTTPPKGGGRMVIGEVGL